MVVAATSGPSRPKIPHHPQFYLPDGNAIFLVDDQLFNVHRSFLMKDKNCIFTSMFNLPQGATQAQGSKDEDPIILPHVSSKDFEAIVKFLYASFVMPIRELVKIQREHDWTAIYSLADRWCMESLTDALKSIIKQPMSPIPTIDIFLISLRHPRDFASEITQSAFSNLCTRKPYISVEESIKLGGPLTSIVMGTREELGNKKAESQERVRIISDRYRRHVQGFRT